MSSEREIRNGIVQVGRRLYERGYIVAEEGNVSARMGDSLYFTPTRVCKGFLTVEAIIKTDLNGRVTDGTGTPSSEAPLHLQIYAARADVKAVVHAHPVHATAFAAAGLSLDTPVLPEVVLSLGSVPLAVYGTPSTDEVVVAIRDLIRDHDAILLANHGALTCGHDLQTAYSRMETLEHFAHIMFVARMLGGEQAIPRGKLDQLYSVFSKQMPQK